MQLIRSVARPFYRRYLLYRRAQRIRQQQRAWQREIAAQRANGQPVRLVIGSGGIPQPGWITTDLPNLDVLKANHWQRIFGPYRADRLLAEHVFEHLTTEQFSAFLHIARPFIAPEGFIRIAVPDGNHPDPDYIARVRPGGTGRGAADHKVLYTCDLMSSLLATNHYDFRLLEYFDPDGEFHRQAWETADGMISRSAEHDHRNQARPLSYTSLIVDCWPARQQQP
jgi:predicted SAM-dependent methyltransferase